MSSPNAQFGNLRKECVSGLSGYGARSLIRRLALGVTIVSTSLAGGCARRAYNDVYVENMAAEIRDLEDQLYEFDGEYRVLEQQLEAARAEAARLRGALPAPKNRTLKQETIPNNPSSPSDGMSSDYFVPRAGASSNPLPPATSSKTTPSAAPSLDVSPGAPLNPTTPKSSPPANKPPGNTPSLTPAPLPAPKPAPGADQFNPNDLLPPTIEPGEPMPPNMPAPSLPAPSLPGPSMPGLGINPANPVTMQSDNGLELELGQIKLPAQLASLQTGNQPDESVVRSAQIHPAAEMPSDTRIVDIKFHPSLCRAVNSDQQGDDDGLYLVLQPYNTSGEFVPLPADLMVLALDLSREEKKATIGRWTLSSADVKSKMNPIGSSQGIHLSLSFSGPAPQCDRVLVFAYYTLPDGRRVVAEQEVMLNNLHRQNAIWVPRSKGEVRTVGHETPVRR